MSYQIFALDFLPAARLNVALTRLSGSLASGELAAHLLSRVKPSCQRCVISSQAAGVLRAGAMQGMRGQL